MKTLTLKCDILFKNITSILYVHIAAHILIINIFVRLKCMHSIWCTMCFFFFGSSVCMKSFYFSSLVSYLFVNTYDKAAEHKITYNNNNKHRQMLNFSSRAHTRTSLMFEHVMRRTCILNLFINHVNSKNTKIGSSLSSVICVCVLFRECVELSVYCLIKML